MPSVKVFFNDEEIQQHNLVNAVYIVGRQEGCDIHIDNLGISRNHARLIQQAEAYLVEDLGSSNGTYVNAQKVDRQSLADGDVITFGKFSLRYSTATLDGVVEASDDPKTESVMDFQMETMNTMAMDAGAMRKRMEELKAEGGPDAGGGDETIAAPRTEETKPEAQPGLGSGEPITQSTSTQSASQAEERARKAELEMLRRDAARNRTVLIVVILLVAAGAAAAYFMGMFK